MATTLAWLVVLGLVILFGYQASLRASSMAAVDKEAAKPAVSAKNKGDKNAGASAPNSQVAAADDQIADPQDLEKVVPDGKELKFDEFEKRAGKDIAQLLSPLNPTHIRRDGSKFTLTCSPTTVSKSGVSVYVGGKVTCEATRNGNVITLKKVDGVEVDLGLGRFKLREAVITPGANNTAKVDGKLEVSRWLPYVPFSVTVDVTP